MLVAETSGGFVGFVAGWIEQDDAIAETREIQSLWIRLGYLRASGLAWWANRDTASGGDGATAGRVWNKSAADQRARQ